MLSRRGFLAALAVVPAVALLPAAAPPATPAPQPETFQDGDRRFLLYRNPGPRTFRAGDVVFDASGVLLGVSLTPHAVGETRWIQTAGRATVRVSANRASYHYLRDQQVARRG